MVASVACHKRLLLSLPIQTRECLLQCKGLLWPLLGSSAQLLCKTGVQSSHTVCVVNNVACWVMCFWLLGVDICCVERFGSYLLYRNYKIFECRLWCVRYRKAIALQSESKLPEHCSGFAAAFMKSSLHHGPVRCNGIAVASNCGCHVICLPFLFSSVPLRGFLVRNYFAWILTLALLDKLFSILPCWKSSFIINHQWKWTRSVFRRTHWYFQRCPFILFFTEWSMPNYTCKMYMSAVTAERTRWSSLLMSSGRRWKTSYKMGIVNCVVFVVFFGFSVFLQGVIWICMLSLQCTVV